MSDGFLAGYLRQCLGSAERWLDAYDAAIALAPDDDSKHMMVRFAEQCRVRVDVLNRLGHHLGMRIVSSCSKSNTETAITPTAGPWWQILHQLWLAECAGYQHLAVLRTIGETLSDAQVLRAVGELEQALDERIHVLQAMTHDSIPAQLATGEQPSAA